MRLARQLVADLLARAGYRYYSKLDSAW